MRQPFRTKRWRLIQALMRSQEAHFGIRLFDAYGAEAKGQKLLRTKTYRLANQKPPLPAPQRAALAHAAPMGARSKATN